MGGCVGVPFSHLSSSSFPHSYKILNPFATTAYLFVHHRPSIQSDIAAGTTVIIDRYYYSGCVYSAAKQNPTLSLAWSRHPEVGLPRPDLCLFLDISAEDAAKRGGFGTEKYEKKELQDRVRGLFNVMMESQEKDDFVRVDAGASVEEVQRRIREEVERVVERVDSGGLPLRSVESW